MQNFKLTAETTLLLSTAAGLRKTGSNVALPLTYRLTSIFPPNT